MTPPEMTPMALQPYGYAVFHHREEPHKSQGESTTPQRHARSPVPPVPAFSFSFFFFCPYHLKATHHTAVESPLKCCHHNACHYTTHTHTVTDYHTIYIGDTLGWRDQWIIRWGCMRARVGETGNMSVLFSFLPFLPACHAFFLLLLPSFSFFLLTIISCHTAHNNMSRNKKACLPLLFFLLLSFFHKFPQLLLFFFFTY